MSLLRGDGGGEGGEGGAHSWWIPALRRDKKISMRTPVSLKWMARIESTRYLARGLSCDGWLVEEVAVRATVVIGQNNNR